ncbi:MAG: glycosyltransferase family 4 protein [Pseudomonadota bacterium]
MHIGYLGPEIPALSMTFVYREIVGLRERGHQVSVYSVRRPDHVAEDADVGDVTYLYDRGAVGQFFAALGPALGNIGGTAKVKLRVLSDLAKGFGEVGGQASFLAYQALVGVRLGKMLKDAGVEHLHIHFAHTPTQIGMYAAQFAGIPFSMMGHANDLFERPLLLKEKGDRSKAFVMISDHNAKVMRQTGVAEAKLPIVRCGVPDVPHALPQRKEYRDAPVIGSLGRLVEKKGMRDLIDAFAMVLPDVPQAKLEIVGNGPLREQIEAQIASLGIEERVELKGAMPNSEVLAWLKGLDLAVLACKRDPETDDQDGIPVALMEAMAFGVPVISTEISGIPELIVDGQTGRLGKPGNAKSIADAMRASLTDYDATETLRQNALDHLRTEFSLDVNLARLEQIFSGDPA